MSTDAVQITLSAKDELRGALDQASASLNRFHKSAEASLEGASKAFTKLDAARTAVVAGFAYLSHKVLESVDALSKESRALNSTTEALGAMKFAMGLAGVGSDEASQGLGLFTKVLGEASDESTAAAASFRKLHIATQENGKDRAPLDVLMDVVDAFSRIESAGEKAATAQALFGRGSRQMIEFLSQGKEAVRSQTDEFIKLGGAVSGMTAQQVEAFNDNISKLGTASKGAAIGITSLLLPSLLAATTALVDGVKSAREFATEHSKVREAALAAAGGIVILTAAFYAMKAASANVALTGVVGSVSALKTGLGSLGVTIAPALAVLGKLTLALGAVSTALWVAVKARNAFGTQAGESETAMELGRGNDRLAASIKSVIAEQEESGKLSKEQADSMRQQVAAASQLDAIARSKTLGTMARGFAVEDSSGGAAAEKELTKQILDQRLAEKDVLIETEQLIRQRQAIETTGEMRALAERAGLKQEELLIEEKRELVQEALEKGVITQAEYSRLELDAKKGLFAVEQARSQTAQNTLRLELQATETALQKHVQDLEIKRQTDKADFRITDAEQRRLEIQSLTEETRLLREQIDLLTQRRDAATTDESRFSIQEQIQSTQGKLSATQGRLSSTEATADPESLKDQAILWIKQFQTVAQSVTATMNNVFSAAFGNIGNHLGNVIRGTETWGQMLQHIGSTVMDAVIQGIVDMFVAWIFGRLKASVAHKTATVTEGATEVAAKTPGALLSSISSWGVAAAVGLAALVAAMAAFETGGYTGDGGRSEPAGIVHRGEYVLTAEETSRLGISRIEAFKSGVSKGFATGGLVGPIVNMEMARSSDGSQEVQSNQHNFTFVTLNSHQEIENYMRSAKGKAMLVNTVRGMATEIGIRS